MNQPEIRYVLASSNTVEGFLSFIPELIKNLRQVYILKGAADGAVSSFIRMCGEFFYEKGCALEFWVSSVAPFNIDGVYVPSLGIAVVKGTLPEEVEPLPPGIGVEFINLGDFIGKGIREERINELNELADKLREEQAKAFKEIKNAGRIKEEIYTASPFKMDITRLQELTQKLIADMEKGYERERHYFAWAFTPEGRIDYMEEISRRCHRRYILKGPAGSGKSTVINNLAEFFREKGYFLEYYHNGLNRESLDMLIVENLRTAIIDGGEKGILTRPGDVVIDMRDFSSYSEEEDIDRCIDLMRSYEKELEKAREYLEKSRDYLQKIDLIWTKGLDLAALEEKRRELERNFIKEY
ncbi:hypothetical protein [Thermosyntropha sp.]|uniref:hypothetical protein n=1 Tax=Thermosyntropha sp. TaxID=2740820 RepID=UPI0025E35FC1|nr:hypothetical protein [Thermosyntropha sp.]MBO8159015.1 hypothetical protein [Thermosyntropha sp.]